MPKLFGGPSSRAIWPSIARSVPLAQCSVEAQLLFERLISQADDQGRQQGEPVLIAAACMPLIAKATPKRIERWIDELQEAQLVVWYQSRPESQWLLQISNWWDHQGGQRWIYPSRWPPPAGWEDRDPKTPTPITDSLSNGPSSAGTTPASRRKDSGTTPASRRHHAGVTPDVGDGSGVGVGDGLDDAGRTPANVNGESLSDDERAEAVAANQALLDDPKTPESVRKAAQHTVERLTAQAAAR